MLETDSQSRASLQEDDTGRIQVDPSTRLRLLSMGLGLKRIALDRGTIHTYIWAPPGQFVVDTPSAVTVDLGCAYTLQVDDSGAGMVRMAMNLSSRPEQPARPGRRSVPARRTSRIHPQSSALL
jgi:hypothetical protein